MDDIMMMDAVERYVNGTMTAGERAVFEDMRRQNTELDQLVVEHQMFLHQLDDYGKMRQAKHWLHGLHQSLLDSGDITESEAATKGVVRQLWVKHRRTIAVAASIAGITAITISGALQVLSPKAVDTNYLQTLSRKVNELDAKSKATDKKVANIIANTTKSPEGSRPLSAGSGFLVDGDGYLITNSHVVAGATTLVVVNKGVEYLAKTVYTDTQNDLAILLINDKDWKKIPTLPYGLRKTAVDLGEEVFTLGYPRNEVVYNRGYMSASSGFNDDTLSIQIAISANPGNSGGPLLDKNGDVIGVLSTRDRQANEVVFGTKSINISRAVQELKKDTAHKSLAIGSINKVKYVDRVQQIKRIQDCVFMVKGY
ncbi:MAG: serine protease [Bacteroidetes bacterium]|nr:MAG: serine protease [Bacteroidota bacterium]